MKEKHRRVMSNMRNSGTDVYVVDAEIAVEDEERDIFLHAQMASESLDILFEAHTNRIYDVYYELNIHDGRNPEKYELFLAKRDEWDKRYKVTDIDIEERYAEQYEQLVLMIMDKAVEDGMKDCFFELFEDKEGWEDKEDG